MFTRILVPTDFSEASEAALEYARRLAARFSASLHVIHVVDEPVTGAFGTELYVSGSARAAAAWRAEAEQRLAARFPLTDVGNARITTAVVEGPAAAVIVETAAAIGADVIVMGTHGRTGLAHAIMGSVAEQVVRTAPCPVMTLHALTGRAYEPAGVRSVAIAMA